MKRLTKTQIIQMHNILLERTGGSPGIRDGGLLEASIEAPFATFDSKDLYSSIEAKAAQLAFCIIRNHPFVDGNKRTGLLAMIIFLEINKIPIICSDDELIELGLSLANGNLTRQDLINWIHEHS